MLSSSPVLCSAQRDPMKAVILAGGEGTRLRPLTLSTPKPVVPVVDRPFLRHQLDLLSRAGIREVVFSVAYRPERVEAVFGDGAPSACASATPSRTRRSAPAAPFATRCRCSTSAPSS